MNYYIDFDLVKKYPNKYNLTPKNIKSLKVLDWDRLKDKTWKNVALSSPCWCHLCGCEPIGRKYDDFSEFWIGFYENGKVDCSFSTWEGMGSYNFDTFYNLKDIECDRDMNVQVNAIRYLNELIDEEIVGFNE